MQENTPNHPQQALINQLFYKSKTHIVHVVVWSSSQLQKWIFEISKKQVFHDFFFVSQVFILMMMWTVEAGGVHAKPVMAERV